MNKRGFISFAAVLLIGGVLELQAAVPNLVGTWTGTGKAVSLENGYYNVTFTITVADQKENLFRGTLKIGVPGRTFTQKFTAFIDNDLTITANYRESSGEEITEALSWGKYIAPTTKQPKAGYRGHWINALNQDSGTMILLKK